jgi:hypothetical protein
MVCKLSTVSLLSFFWIFLFFVGCAKDHKDFRIKGTVSYQGKPLSSGVIRLHMANGRVAAARIRPDGSFEITDVIPGEVKVTIEEDPAEIERRTMPLPQVPMKPAVMKSSVQVPAKYKDAKTSDLVFTLVPGQPLKVELH